jgi:drug/metabolite transporter (DMT)-like permease
MTASPAARHPLRGIALLLLAQLLFVTLDATGKHLSASLPVPLLVWARYGVHLLLMLLFVAPAMRARLVKTERLPLQLLRAATLLVTSLLFLSALRHLPLAEGTAISFIMPFIVTVLSVPMLGERVTGKRWLAVIVGFAGMLLVTRPGTELSGSGVALALAAALCFSFFQIMTSKLAATDNSLTTLFYTALVGTVMMSAMLPWFWIEREITAPQLALIVSMGLSGGIGHFLLIRAYHHAPASTLTPFIYTQLIWATLLGWLVFGQFPDAWSLSGIAVIAASGLWMVLGERRRVRPS